MLGSGFISIFPVVLSRQKTATRLLPGSEVLRRMNLLSRQETRPVMVPIFHS